MRYAALALLAVVCVAPPSSVRAQDSLLGMAVRTLDTIPDAQYFSGREGMDHKQDGFLVLSVAGISFRDKHGVVIFDLPMAEVTDVAHETDIRDASVGKKMLFGSTFSGTRKQEFVTITTETNSTAEAIVFKVKQNTSTRAVAKINYYRKKSGAKVLPDSGAAAVNQGNPLPAK